MIYGGLQAEFMGTKHSEDIDKYFQIWVTSYWEETGINGTGCS